MLAVGKILAAVGHVGARMGACTYRAHAVCTHSDRVIGFDRPRIIEAVGEEVGEQIWMSANSRRGHGHHNCSGRKLFSQTWHVFDRPNGR